LKGLVGRDRLTLAALASVAVPMATLTLPITTFIPEHYARVVGLDLAVIGATFMFVRLFDIAIDQVLGLMMDRTATRWGRFKPWLAGGTPLVMIGAGMLFFPKPGYSATYLAVALIITYIGYSLVILSQLGLAAGLSNEYEGRSRVFSWWQAGTTAGLVLAMTTASFAGGKGIDASFAVHSMGIIVIVLTPIGTALALRFIPDGTTRSTNQKIGGQLYLQLICRSATARLLGLELLLGLAVGIASASAILFCLAVKHLSVSQYSFTVLWYFIVAIVSAPLCAALARRMQKHRALMAAAVGYAMFPVIQANSPPGTITMMLVASTLGGFAFTAASMLPRAMVADISDEVLLETGIDSTGILYALLTGVYKVGQAVAIGVVFTSLDLIGYDVSAGRENAQSALMGLTIVYGVVPAALASISMVLMIGYPLTAARHAHIREALRR